MQGPPPGQGRRRMGGTVLPAPPVRAAPQGTRWPRRSTRQLPLPRPLQKECLSELIAPPAEDGPSRGLKTRSLAQMEPPVAYVCADSRIYDATEWFLCQVVPVTHSSPFELQLEIERERAR